MSAFTPLLEPRSIAVVGASTVEGKTGNVILSNLIENGFGGPVYPIHPTASEILGLRAYPTLSHVPGPVDLVFVVVPRELVKEVMEQCERKGVRAACIVSAGFAEAGEEGAKAQAELEAIIRRSGIRCIGPNTIGFVNAQTRVVGSFTPLREWRAGPVALAAQSGTFCGALADELLALESQRLGFALAVSLGNKIDLDEVDFVTYAGANPAVRVVALHLESLRRPRAFLDEAGRVAREKPVVVLKPGRSATGARASASHTGALAANDRLVDAGFRQFGITRAYDLEEFLAYIKAFAYQPLAPGPRVGIVTWSGGNGVMAVDEMAEAGLELATFVPETERRLAAMLPAWQPAQNPADLWMALGSGNRRAHEEGIGAALDDPGTDAVLAILLPLPITDFPEVREVFAAARARHPEKPLFLTMIGGPVKRRWMTELEGLEIPIFSGTRLPVLALAAMERYRRYRERGR
ncbi:MAG: CoA-binding protein [Deltaproteobacteria bacterium]|nr:CoA-binding protein [Deltaproteobacteria bacterium]MBI3078473.1 CoA-binding protein [Deltaproteobacteria bacterium]